MAILPLLPSCKTVDMEKNSSLPRGAVQYEEIREVILEQSEAVPVPEVVYVEMPVYYPADSASAAAGKTGKDAVTAHLSEVTKIPEYDSGLLRRYSYHPDFIYEIHCQTYHMTDIELEPGEEVLETPYISEPDVWQIAEGTSFKDGQPVTHFFVKPDYQKQISNMIIVTNRRVYHLELKSFLDYHMPIVRWSYPLDVLKRQQEKKAEQERQNSAALLAENLSFNYKVTKSIFYNPPWVPIQIYDDGRRTYVVLDEACLNQELPALFNEKNEIVNYRVSRNTLVADQLISKMTLRLGKKKVTVQKKKA
jgi:type IV secretion system protein VirB9